MVAHEAEAGIKTAKAENPDLILLDIMMPGMDGAQAVTIIKSDDSIKNIPIIFFTGLVSQDDKGMGLSEGINIGNEKYQSIAKPFENEELVDTIRKVVS